MSDSALLAKSRSVRQLPSRRVRRRRFAYVLTVVAVVALGLPSVALVTIFRWAHSDNRTPTDAIVVLGAAQYQGAPSPVLANRLAHAREIAQAGVSKTIVTVGGFRQGDVTSEAQTGKDELVGDGMRRSQVVAIPFGANTAESLENVAAVAGSENWRSVTLVTDPAHAARARELARANGLTAYVSTTVSGPGTELTPRYLLHESLGLIAIWFR